MNDKVCKNCAHFRQHYVKMSWGYLNTNCGHCVYPKIKTRKPGTLACVYFEEAELEQICEE